MEKTLGAVLAGFVWTVKLGHNNSNSLYNCVTELNCPH
jgi:hypothetical protein